MKNCLRLDNISIYQQFFKIHWFSKQTLLEWLFMSTNTYFSHWEQKSVKNIRRKSIDSWSIRQLKLTELCIAHSKISTMVNDFWIMNIIFQCDIRMILANWIFFLACPIYSNVVLNRVFFVILAIKRQYHQFVIKFLW